MEKIPHPTTPPQLELKRTQSSKYWLYVHLHPNQKMYDRVYLVKDELVLFVSKPNLYVGATKKCGSQYPHLLPLTQIVQCCLVEKRKKFHIVKLHVRGGLLYRFLCWPFTFNEDGILPITCKFY